MRRFHFIFAALVFSFLFTPVYVFGLSGFTPQLAFVESTDPREDQFRGGFDVFLSDIDREGVVQLTHEGTNFTPAWSSDGKFIAFTSDRTGRLELFLMRPGGGFLQPLGVEGRNPSWSPDGRYLAYDRVMLGREKVFVYDLVNEKEMFLAFGNHPSWSPDGERIALTGAIYEFDPVHGSRFVRGIGEKPSWSPGGDLIALEAEHQIFLLDLRNDQIRRVTSGGATANFDVSWDADGHLIYRGAEDGTSKLYVHDVVTGKRRAFLDAEGIVTARIFGAVSVDYLDPPYATSPQGNFFTTWGGLKVH